MEDDTAATSSPDIDTPDPNVPPDEAIRWLTRNCDSNVELATYSNVSSQWRDVVATTMHDDIVRSYGNYLSEQDELEASSSNSASGSKKKEQKKQEEQGQSSDEDNFSKWSTCCSKSGLAAQFPFARLLLPEMSMELLERRRACMADNNEGGTGQEILVPISGGDDMSIQEIEEVEEDEEDKISENDAAAQQQPPTEGQFCLAWFAPSGISMHSVRVGVDGDEHDSVSSSSSEGIPDTDVGGSVHGRFVPSGQDTYDLSETEEVAVDDRGAMGRRRRGADKVGSGSGGGGGVGNGGGASSAPDSGGLLAGQMSPIRRGRLPVRVPVTRTREVARSPKGGKKSAEDGKGGRLQTCALSWSSYRSAMDVLLPFGYATTFVRGILEYVLEVSALYWSASGDGQVDGLDAAATNSGPFDNLMTSNDNNANTAPKTTFAVRGATLARPEGYCLRWDEDEHEIEAALKAESSGFANGGYSSGQTGSKDENERRRREYRRKRARQLLKQRRRERKRVMRERLPRLVTSTREKDPQYLDSNHGYDGQGGRRQRCIQFLNANGTHAVRLRTKPFACGTIRSPITMFCVGIATEDGCFVSGLRNRFELGHLYPSNPRDSLVDMSPACLVTNQREDDDTVQQAQVAMPKVASATGTLNSGFASASEGRRYWDDSCHSSIPSVRNDDSDDSSDDSSDDDSKSAGDNCNCAFCSSRINADECDDEPDENIIYRGLLGPGAWHCYVAVFDGENSYIRIDGATEPQTETDISSPRTTPGLDGLTIGSDHIFDMSLCYGGGDDGEGEGAISELAVFKGRMPLSDIEQMEKYLMKKHGIATCTDKNERWQEDEWKRQAYALIAQPPPYRLTGDPVPLRVAANHRSVAWYRNCDVTGKEIPVSRIGCRFGKGSSDW